MTAYNKKLKVVIVGDSGVGKTALFGKMVDLPLRFIQVINPEFKTIDVLLDDQRINLLIWDIPVFKIGPPTCLSRQSRSANIVLLMYDISNIWSFNSLGEWYKRIKRLLPTTTTVLIGNKKDLDDTRKITYYQEAKFAQDHGLIFIEISSQTGENIDTLIKTAVENWHDAHTPSKVGK